MYKLKKMVQNTSNKYDTLEIRKKKIMEAKKTKKLCQILSIGACWLINN